MRKVIIAGGRDFTDRWSLWGAMIDLFAEDVPHDGRDFVEVEMEVVCGGADGADYEGKVWAEAHNFPVRMFPADWDQHGKAAGPIRNAEMAQYADTLVAFWDGESRGTRNMIGNALREGLEIHVYHY